MKTLKTVPGQNLVLGHRGENLATRIIFSIAPWVETYGPGTAHLLHQRQGDSEPYPVATLQEGTEVSWDVTDGDTAMEGYGKYELRYYVAETLVKSSVGETYTMKALQYGAEPPDPIQGWVDHVLEKENEIYEAASETKGYSESAERAAGDALNFANAADQSAGNARLSAKTAADQAGQAAGSAKEAKEAAEEARKIVDGADVVKSVNGQGPDENGNVQIEVGTGSGVDVTAKPGQLIRVKSVDENGKPTAWEAVPWGYTEGGMVEILPECQPTYIEDGEGIFVIEEDLALVAGRTYIVNWNGTEYTCIGQDMSATAPGAVLLGNLGAVDGTIGTGEPFVIVKENAWVAAPLDGTTELTLAIYQKSETVHPIPGKFLPEGVPYVEQGEMVEIPVAGEWREIDEGQFAFMSNPIGLEIGKTYVVNWDGADYEVVGIDYATISGGEASGVFLGNGGFIGLEDTGEPFSVADIVVGNESGTMFLSTDFTANHTFTISQKSETVHKMDNRCLDLAWLPTKKDETVTLLEGDFTFDSGGSFGGVLDAARYQSLDTKLEFVPGQTYTVNFNGTPYKCVCSLVDVSGGSVYGIGNRAFREQVDDNGVPFCIETIPDYNVVNIFTTKAYVNTDVQIEVIGDSVKINKLPEEFLPESVNGVIIRSSTANSTKQFKLTVDDSGTITATEV